MKNKCVSLKDKLPLAVALQRNRSESGQWIKNRFKWNRNTKQIQIFSFQLHPEAFVCSFCLFSDSSLYHFIHPRLLYISETASITNWHLLPPYAEIHICIYCRKWNDYKLGFGKFQGKNDEYWLGNDHIYDLLARGASILPLLIFPIRLR